MSWWLNLFCYQIPCWSSPATAATAASLMGNALEYVKDNGGIHSEDSYPDDKEVRNIKKKKKSVYA